MSLLQAQLPQDDGLHNCYRNTDGNSAASFRGTFLHCFPCFILSAVGQEFMAGHCQAFNESMRRNGVIIGKNFPLNQSRLYEQLDMLKDNVVIRLRGIRHLINLHSLKGWPVLDALKEITRNFNIKFHMDSSSVKPRSIREDDPIGIVPVRRISNLPVRAKVKLRLRAKEVAKAYVKHEGAVTCWILWSDGNGEWMLKWKTGQNVALPESAMERGAT